MTAHQYWPSGRTLSLLSDGAGLAWRPLATVPHDLGADAARAPCFVWRVRASTAFYLLHGRCVDRVARLGGPW